MFLPREVIEARLNHLREQVEGLAARPEARGWPLQLAEAGRNEAAGDLAKLDMIERLAGALDACLLQIAQMKGMFDDSDGAIAAADEAGHDALTGWFEVKAADLQGYYGKGC